MNRLEQIRFLNEYLLGEMPVYREQAGSFPADEQSQRPTVRCWAALSRAMDVLIMPSIQPRGCS